MDFVNLPLLAVAALVFSSVLTGLFSTRIGFSFLLVFLFAGILAGQDGPGGYRFDDVRISFWVGNVALAIILLDGGLRTRFETFRTGLRPASLLATAGVVVSAAVVALAGVLVVGLDWPTAMLLGAIVGSTDAAAVFSLLSRSGVTLNERVSATLEIESGVNDPMAIYLTIVLIAWLSPTLQAGAGWQLLGLTFVQQFGVGALVGWLSGLGMAALLQRIASRDAGGGILALLIGAAGLSVFAATGLLGGSGFLAVYLMGLVVANRAKAMVASSLPAMDGYAWLSQAGMFLLLGLLVTPSTMLPFVGPGLAVAFTLIFVARPLAVWLCLRPFHFSARETWFIAWVGLRGAVPIVLALFPLLAGTPQAAVLFNMAFVVVLTSLLLQGATIGWLARRLGMEMPDPSNEQAVRAVFRDFVLDPHAEVGAVCLFYGLPEPEQPHLSLAEWMQLALRRPPVAGDTVPLGPAVLVVRDIQDGRIAHIGMGLPAAQTN
jgi:cell volume regulation protein A